MYKVGDYLMHETSGVCQVKEISEKALHGKGSEKLYYCLEPIFEKGKSTVITPVDSNTRIRDVKSSGEFEKLLDEIPGIDVIHEEGNRARTEKFKEKISLFDPKPLASVVKSIYLHQKKRIASGKKPMSSDERVMDVAGKRLFEEMAFSMKSDMETVKKAFFGRLDGEDR
ncbi:CarD family transcriptional regulator [Candidatus Weimeria sp. HCP3S3_B5]|uniref:CarD family transcriptional regulator n=1 Tax=Candidatus Weimeria sp. HCP3S3_B5 TaxID=3438871 RepID=UPI002A9400B5|nr:CarD family transcriptional regulator [Lachnospiraceae bacterium]MDY6352079.1 CarD family transcriptional regulator [Lachnospiraceae bacterium]